jgi:exonuclease SbcC
MKINQLRFKNLNSLAGEWTIDFTAPEYISDGIFAIAGPTGAGKSTILDAICLALYGRTPRLKTISKSSNEIMSRQTGECFAEVVFETHEGRFRAFWSQRRAKEKAEGALQNPEHELSNADTKKVLTSQLTSTGKEIEKKSGMDYGRFIQSMMLAQGGFAAFLQASGNERAPILEQITGTEIYSNISIHVFDRQRTEKAQLENLKAENSGIKLLSREEEEIANKELAEKNKDKVLLSAKVEQLDNAVKWLATIDAIKTELEKISIEESTLAKEVAEFEPKRVILDKALKALPLDGEFSALTVMRNQQNIDLASLTGLQVQTPELDKAMASAQIVFDSAEKQFADANTEKNKLFEITQQVRLLDQEIEQKNSATKNIEFQISRLTNEKQIEVDKVADATKLIDGFRNELLTVEKYLADNQADLMLATELTGIKANIAGLAESQKLYLSAENHRGESIKSLETLAK